MARQQQVEQQQQQQVKGHAAPPAPLHAEKLGQQLTAAGSTAEVEETAEHAVVWLATLLPPPAVSLLQLLVAKLTASSSSHWCQACRASVEAAAVPPPANQQRSGSGNLAGSLQVQQLFQQCSALQGEKASLERLNQELLKQVACMAGGRGGCPHHG